MYYQTLVRWNVDANVDAKPEMPRKNSEAEYLGFQATPLQEGDLN